MSAKKTNKELVVTWLNLGGLLVVGFTIFQAIYGVYGFGLGNILSGFFEPKFQTVQAQIPTPFGLVEIEGCGSCIPHHLPSLALVCILPFVLTRLRTGKWFPSLSSINGYLLSLVLIQFIFAVHEFWLSGLDWVLYGSFPVFNYHNYVGFGLLCVAMILVMGWCVFRNHFALGKHLIFIGAIGIVFLGWVATGTFGDSVYGEWSPFLFYAENLTWYVSMLGYVVLCGKSLK